MKMKSYKLITCVMKEHIGASIVNKLKDEKNIVTANRSFARGNSVNHITDMEMEILTVLVESDMADEIFEYLYFECEFDKPHKGIIYQASIPRSSEYHLQ